MKFRSTILLLAVALGIGAYIWFVEKSQLSTDEREEKEKLVFSVKADEIDRVGIEKVNIRSVLTCKSKHGVCAHLPTCWNKSICL